MLKFRGPKIGQKQLKFESQRYMHPVLRKFFRKERQSPRQIAVSYTAAKSSVSAPALNPHSLGDFNQDF